MEATKHEIRGLAKAIQQSSPYCIDWGVAARFCEDDPELLEAVASELGWGTPSQGWHYWCNLPTPLFYDCDQCGRTRTNTTENCEHCGAGEN